jgi:hypothetical protein
VNINTLVGAILLFVITLIVACLNGDCGPGISSPAALRRAIAAPPMPDEAPADGGFDPIGKPEPSLREVMIELREVKALLQSRGAVAGILPTLVDNPFARLKMPTWNLGGEPTPAAANSEVGSERGRKERVRPVTANSTSDMQQGVCVPGVFASPPPPERKGRSRSKARREREYDDR